MLSQLRLRFEFLLTHLTFEFLTAEKVEFHGYDRPRTPLYSNEYKWRCCLSLSIVYFVYCIIKIWPHTLITWSKLSKLKLICCLFSFTAFSIAVFKELFTEYPSVSVSISFRDIHTIIERYREEIERVNGQIQFKDGYDIKSKSFKIYGKGYDQ